MPVLAPFPTRVPKGIRGLSAPLPPALPPSLKKNPARSPSRNPSTVPPPPPSITATAVGRAEASPGRRHLTQKPRRVETLPMWSRRKITPTNTWTTMPPTVTITTERSPTGAVSTDTGSLGTVPGTWIESRTTTSATNNGAGTNPRIAIVTRTEKASPKNGTRLGSGTGMFTSASDLGPFTFLFFFLKSCIPPPSDSIFGVYIAVICDLSCILCIAVARIAIA